MRSKQEWWQGTRRRKRKGTSEGRRRLERDETIRDEELGKQKNYKFCL